MINALRGHLAEQGVVAPKGTIHVKRLSGAVADEAIGLSEAVRELAAVYLCHVEGLSVQIAAQDRQIKGGCSRSRSSTTGPG